MPLSPTPRDTLLSELILRRQLLAHPSPLRFDRTRTRGGRNGGKGNLSTKTHKIDIEQRSNDTASDRAPFLPLSYTRPTRRKNVLALAPQKKDRAGGLTGSRKTFMVRPTRTAEARIGSGGICFGRERIPSELLGIAHEVESSVKAPDDCDRDRHQRLLDAAESL